MILTVVTGCNPQKNTTQTPASNSNVTSMIPFKKNYTSKKGTPLTFTNQQTMKVKMFNENEMNLTGTLFSENLEVKDDGKGYVINPALDKLSTIPAHSEWKVNSIQKNPVDQSTTLMMTCTLADGQATYAFPVKENTSNGMFYIVPDAKGTITWNGQDYEVKGGNTKMLYFMIDPIKGLKE